MTFFSGCKNDLDSIVEEVEFDRLLSPGNLIARIRTQTTLEVSWFIRDNVDSYVVEFSQDSLEFGEIIRTVSVLPEDMPIQEEFFGDVLISVRVKAISDGESESNWTSIAVRIPPEQIFLPAPIIAEDTYATLLWTAGTEVTNLLIQPGNIYIPLSDEQKALGEAVVTGLNGATQYTATIYNGTQKRGTKTFTTLKDANVTPFDDLGAIIDAAEEGAILILEPGTYALGSKTITKSITIEGQKINDMPIINGQFACATPVTSITLKNLKIDGLGGYGQFFNASAAACNLGTLTVDACEITGFNNNIIYNNSGGTYGDIIITNSYIHDIPGGGGDGFDIRGGALGSLTVENTTIAIGIRTMLRLQVAGNVAFRNVTFYKTCTVLGGNNRGFFRSNVGGSLEVSNCLFVETGVNDGGTLRGNWTLPGDVNEAVLTDFDDNYYFEAIGLFDGQFNATECDATEADPEFEDAENADYTVTNQLLIDEQIGDPRWWF